MAVGQGSGAERGAETVVVKVGSAVLMREGIEADRRVFCSLVSELAAAVRAGHRVVLVSSGAVATGRRKMKVAQRPSGERDVPRLQALAALGQSHLMHLYDSEFAHYDLHVAQLLLTREDFNDRKRYLNVKNTLQAVHDFGAIPVINENDTVTTDEIRFGDNDQLAALVATLTQASRLVILSDIDGLYTKNPKLHPDAQRVEQALANDPALDEMIGDIQDAKGFGSGGMRSKLSAARLAARTGIETTIAPGKRAGVLASVLGRDPSVGTRFLPDAELDRLVARKAWIGMGVAPKGRLWCDQGAFEALAQQGRSLLPKGVSRVEGDFDEGDAVDLLSPEGAVFARGLCQYNASQVRAIMGKHTSEIEGILGYHALDAVIHRDNLVLLG
jgi:glutamate 5-kinase